MGKVIRFLDHEARRRGRPAGPADGGPAQILFFTGVRYSRPPSNDGARTGPSRRRRAKRA